MFNPRIPTCFAVLGRARACLVLFYSLIAGLGASLSGQDFSAAFENFRKLGLPDTKDAEYGTVSPAANANYFGAQDPYSQFPGFYDFKTKGNAWRIARSEENESFRVILFQTREQELSLNPENEETPPATFKPVKLEQDWKLLRARFEDENFLSNLESNPSNAADLILFAAHLDRRGMGAEATELVQKVLSHSDNPEATITATIGKLATSQYRTALREAYEDSNWKTFSEQVVAIASRFGRGWPAEAGARRLAEIAAKQASETSLTLANGEPPSPEQQQLLAQLAKLENPQILQSFTYYGPWILPGNPIVEQMQESPDPGMEALRGLIGSGKESIPLLLAMLEDETFLPFATPQADHIATALDQQVSEAYQSLGQSDFQRPATYSDVATFLLATLVPGLETYDLAREEFTPIVADWWEEAKDQSPLEMARTYFREGGDGQAQVGIQYLSEHGTEEDFAKVEDQLIDQAFSSPWADFSLIQGYLSARGESAAPFFQRIKKESEKLLAEMKERKDEELESYQDNFDRNLKNLEAYVSNEGAEEILAKIADGDTEFYEVQEVLFEKLAELPFEEQIRLMLTTIAQIEEVETKSSLLGYLSYLERSEDTELDPKAHESLWKPFLDDTTDIGNGNTIQLNAAWIAENLYAPEAAEELSVFWRSAGEFGSELLLDRIRNRLAGVSGDELPRYPSIDDVSEDRRKGLESELLALEEEALRSRLNELTLAEQIWAVGTARTPQTEEKSESTEQPLQEAIEKLQFTLTLGEIPEGWNELRDLEDQVMSKEAFDTLLEAALSHASTEKSFLLELSRESGFSPFRLSVKEMDLDALLKEDESLLMASNTVYQFMEKEAPFVALSFNKRGYGNYWFPEMETDSMEDYARRSLEQMEARGKQVRDSLDQWFQAPLGFPRGFSISFAGLTSLPPEGETSEEP